MLRGYSIEHVAKRCGVSLETARRWKADGVPASKERLVRVFLHGELGALHDAWEGFYLRNGKLIDQCRYEWLPGQLLSYYLRCQYVSALQQQLKRASEETESLRRLCVDPDAANVVSTWLSSLRVSS